MYVSSLTKLYTNLYVSLGKHIDELSSKLLDGSKTNFLTLPFTSLLIKVFTSMLTFLATLYEFLTYCTTIRVTQLLHHTDS